MSLHDAGDHNIKMYSGGILAVAVALLALFTLPVEALKFGVGDGLAIVLFVIIAVIVTCAVLGWISRKRSGN